MIKSVRTVLFSALCFLAAAACAQQATPSEMGGFASQPGLGVIHLQTRLGSFKIIDGKGRVTVDFSGTFLITKYNGKALVITGKVRKEYDEKGRTVFTGTGQITAEGEWRGLEWFGRDMHATWYGIGIIRLSGEFDRDFKTGDYWYDDAAEKQSWPATSVMTVVLPKPQTAGTTTKVPRERKSGGG